MDRQIVYAASVPLETDVLRTNKNAMVGLGYFIQDILGSALTVAAGLACGPTSPASLAVAIGPGRIYSEQVTDLTAYSSLPADSHQIMKQGILPDAENLACPAPSTSGFSIAYLIEAQYQDVDGSNLTLAYYNATNPSQPYSGPGNTGVAQPTIRSGTVALQVKPGTAATTGTQTPPSADAGWIPLYVVTVANGQSTITSGNIALASGAPFIFPNGSGSFTMTYVGGATAPTGTAWYRQVGPMVTLVLPSLSATSNSTSFGFSGLPAALQPNGFSGALNQTIALGSVQNNGTFQSGGYAIVTAASGQIQFGLNGATAGWTASGTKSASGVITYLVG